MMIMITEQKSKYIFDLMKGIRSNELPIKAELEDSMLSWGEGPLINWFAWLVASGLLALYVWMNGGASFGDPCAGADPAYYQQCMQAYMGQVQ